MSQRTLGVGIVLLMAASGCARTSPPEGRTTNREPSPEGRKYLLDAEPEGALDIIAARQQTAGDEEVTVIGRIGGRVDPWIEGRAAFSLVDRSLAACTDIPGDQCPTPWDYCCVTDKLPGSTALVKFVDDQGQLIATDARQLLGLKELQTVIVQGTAQRDEAGNLTIEASSLFAYPGDMGQYPPGGAAAESHDQDHAHDDAHAHDHDHALGGGRPDAPSPDEADSADESGPPDPVDTEN